MRLAVANERASTVLRFVQTRGGIVHHRRASGRLPDGRSRFSRNGYDAAVPNPIVWFRTFDKLWVVLKISEDYFVFHHHRRSPAPMLADEGAKIPLPDEFSLMIQRRQQIMVRLIPHD